MSGLGDKYPLVQSRNMFRFVRATEPKVLMRSTKGVIGVVCPFTIVEL